MSSSHEDIEVALRYVYSKLTADSTLMGLVTAVYRDVAPLEAISPWIVYQFITGSVVYDFTGVRAYSNVNINVKVVGPVAVMVSLLSAASLLDNDLVTATQQSVTGGTIRSCMQLIPIQTPELVARQQWTNLGGTYRFMAVAS